MININQQSPIPISNQIYDSFKKLILANVMKKDEQLPSVRNIAKDLMVNPNTIHKVYQELLQNNLIYSIPQKGMYVNEIPQHIYDEYLETLIKEFRYSYNNLVDMNLEKNIILNYLDLEGDIW